MRWSRLRIVRKGSAAIRQVPRFLATLRAGEAVYRRRPPGLANSFPKSGTHLLLQVVRALPGAKYYGSFLASTPSLTFRERSERGHLRVIGRIAPAEVLPAHLVYALAYAQALRKRHCAHYFIYRDLRDVAVSEAHYLTFMNPWHRMHGYFRHRLHTVEERIRAVLEGVPRVKWPYDYPDIAQRFGRYALWLEQEELLSIRFEDLVGDRREQSVSMMVRYWCERRDEPCNLDAAVAAALAAINPRGSHTFREGKVGGWRECFTTELAEVACRIAGPLLAKLGYET